MEPMDELPLKELGDERIGEIGAGVKQLEFILESKGSIGLLEERSVRLFVEMMMWMDERV